jgi:glycosyltransferase A (GT-A) superfamily protein (DUF2064 family)
LADHPAVLLIGTDCPALTVPVLHAAAESLYQGGRMVFIPAEDGGYVLVGAGASTNACDHGNALSHPFQAIEWGTPRVMRQTRERLSELGWKIERDWRELPALWDVDTPEDYLRAQRENLLPA